MVANMCCLHSCCTLKTPQRSGSKSFGSESLGNSQDGRTCRCRSGCTRRTTSSASRISIRPRTFEIRGPWGRARAEISAAKRFPWRPRGSPVLLLPQQVAGMQISNWKRKMLETQSLRSNKLREAQHQRKCSTPKSWKRMFARQKPACENHDQSCVSSPTSLKRHECPVIPW